MIPEVRDRQSEWNDAVEALLVDVLGETDARAVIATCQ